jgi:predicted O-linked N-acetylglucosamine transferase (SPINDLY family)
MDNISFKNAFAEHKRGNVERAIEMYTALLNNNVIHRDIYNCLSTALLQKNLPQDAISVLKIAMAHYPKDAELLFRLGAAYLQSKLIPEAQQYLENALNEGFKSVELYYSLGECARLQNDMDKAIHYLVLTIQSKPEHFMAHFNLAMIYKESKMFDTSLSHFKHALKQHPETPECYNNMGLIYEETGEYGKAIECLEKALTLKPYNFQILSNYLSVLIKDKKMDLAIEILSNTVKQNPSNPELLNGLGNLFWKNKNFEEAERCYDSAISVKENFDHAYFNKGVLYRENARYDEAIQSFTKAVYYNSNFADAILNLGETYIVLGEIDKAEKCFKDILSINPEHKVASDNLLLCYNYNAMYSAEKIFLKHQEWGNNVEKSKYLRSFSKTDRIRIGLISPDFCKHPASRFMHALFEFIDSSLFEIYCYAEITYCDEKTDYFKSKCNKWLEINNLSDSELAEIILQDSVSVLFDCAGHMNRNRLEVFTYRPAPLQISAFGYPSTTGLKSIDYRFADSITDPPEYHSYYTEKLLNFDKCFCSFSPDGIAEISTELPAKINGYITFGSLHTTSRLNKKVIDLWSDVLHAVPDSHLLIFRTTLCASVIHRIKSQFIENNISLNRVDFQSKIPESGYLTVYSKIDCQLDTFPWSGHTTACESLCMGVPMLTLYGDRHAGRMVSSILINSGLEDYVAYSEKEYIDKAIANTSDIPRLARLRSDLPEQFRMSTVCDGKEFTKELENKIIELITRTHL